MAAVSERPCEPAKPRVKLPLSLRLKAWWEGHELEVRHKPQSNATRQAPPQPDFKRWSEPHIEFLQAVWGEGFLTPGGEAGLLKLVKPFGLNPAMSLLDIGAGLGGPARLMTKTFGVWVTGLERRPRLAKRGMELSTKAGLEKKAPIVQFDPETFDGKAKSYDCVFSKECFFAVEQKERLIETIGKLLKDTGHVLFTDFVLARTGLNSPAIETWKAGEPDTPRPWAMEQYVEALTDCRLEVCITEDITRDFQRAVTEGWATYLSALGGGEVDKRLAPILVEEVELWTRRIQALESGDLRVCRIYAVRKGVGRLMSDW
ncbi:MAG: SAM-dependent methyltransferase [Kiloniellales bacterium]